MIPYDNYGGNSGVVAFQINTSSISVRFNSGRVYRYSYSKAGRRNIENMKSLAISGQGLNSYINTNVKYLYD